ncbi:hypothetical protein IID23_03045 [Patescibacteria group bacterium]|nr:hypothetical protein [Patescibacteria group bacterium]
MDLNLFFEYLQVTFVSNFAIIQLVATFKNKEKLKIIVNNKLNLIISILLIVLTYYWFFSVRDRNVQTYMEGVQIAFAFGLGAVISILVTKIFILFRRHD